MLDDYYTDQSGWSSIFKHIRSYGSDLNDNHLKQIKGLTNEKLICSLNEGMLHIHNGYDIFDSNKNIRIEVKGVDGALYTKTKGLRESTKKIIMKNDLGHVKIRLSNEEYKLYIGNKFDYLIIIDTENPYTYSAAAISSKDFVEYGDFIHTSGATNVVLPIDKMQILCRPNTILVNMTPLEVSKHRIQTHKIATSFFDHLLPAEEVETISDKKEMFDFMYE